MSGGLPMVARGLNGAAIVMQSTVQSIAQPAVQDMFASIRFDP